ncbi:MAG: hydroxymethylglutaryl-CoA reductase, partial [Thiotrichales bacterium 34-46-19]
MTHSFASIPMQTIGPLRLTGDVDDEIMVPLATYETPLWPSVNRGARVCSAAGGIQVTLLNEQMTRSFAVQADDAQAARRICQSIEARL